MLEPKKENTLLTEDNYPHISVDDQPLYILTNPDCEDTGYWSPEQFTQLGLDYGEHRGKDHPLTDNEAYLIGDDHVMTPASGDLMFGCTALFQGQKWLMPLVEYAQPMSDNNMTQECKILERLIAHCQGRIVINSKGPGHRINVLLLIPFQVAQETFGNFPRYKRYLMQGLGIPVE